MSQNVNARRERGRREAQRQSLQRQLEIEQSEHAVTRGRLESVTGALDLLADLLWARRLQGLTQELLKEEAEVLFEDALADLRVVQR